ncbi:MAG: hypothetical protein AAF571_02585 [Verrucomicrobiota bacterium]
MNFYRLLAPVIEEALRRGWHVECWHDVSGERQHSQKECPQVEAIPTFKNGEPEVLDYENGPEGLQGLLDSGRADVAVTLVCQFLEDHQKDWQRVSATRVALLEPTPADWFGNISHPSHLKKVDLYGLTNEYWREHDIFMLHQCKSHLFGADEEAELRKKIKLVGWPQSDQFQLIDKDSVRSAWGIPDNKKVCAYLNYPIVPMDYSVNGRFFHESGKKKRCELAWKHDTGWRGLWEALAGYSLEDILIELRAFCDRENMFVIGKHRNRDDMLPCEKDFVDHWVTDETLYPHTICQLMSIADISFGWLSMGVRESIRAGCPHVTLDFSGRTEYLFWGEKDTSWLKSTTREGEALNSPPACRFIENYGDLQDSLASLDYNSDEVAVSMQVYRERYIDMPGDDDSSIFCNELEQLIG